MAQIPRYHNSVGTIVMAQIPRYHNSVGTIVLTQIPRYLNSVLRALPLGYQHAHACTHVLTSVAHTCVYECVAFFERMFGMRRA